VWCVIYIFKRIGSDERDWNQMIYLFGAVEAIAFSACGFFFGREVHRDRADKAEQRADRNEHLIQNTTNTLAIAEYKLSKLANFIDVHSGIARQPR
jgi:hypothetical protein